MLLIYLFWNWVNKFLILIVLTLFSTSSSFLSKFMQLVWNLSQWYSDTEFLCVCACVWKEQCESVVEIQLCLFYFWNFVFVVSFCNIVTWKSSRAIFPSSMKISLLLAKEDNVLELLHQHVVCFWEMVLTHSLLTPLMNVCELELISIISLWRGFQRSYKGCIWSPMNCCELLPSIHNL